MLLKQLNNYQLVKRDVNSELEQVHVNSLTRRPKRQQRRLNTLRRLLIRNYSTNTILLDIQSELKSAKS